MSCGLAPMADVLSLGATYSSVQGRARPLPMEHAPALLTIVAALYPHPPRAQPFALPHLGKPCGCHQRARLQGTVMPEANKCLQCRPGQGILRGVPALNHEEERDGW